MCLNFTGRQKGKWHHGLVRQTHCRIHVASGAFKCLCRYLYYSPEVAALPALNITFEAYDKIKACAQYYALQSLMQCCCIRIA